MTTAPNQQPIALVTGGGRRLGRSISMALSAAGYHVVLHYRQSRQEAEATALELDQSGTGADCLAADLEQPKQIEELFAALEERHGRLHLLVNSAASFDKRPLDEIDVEAWDQTLAVNLRAAFLCTRQASPLLRRTAAAGGEATSVVNIADLSGLFPWPGYSHHGVSKAGLLHLTRVTARELAPEIRVNAVIPGPILPPPGAGSDDRDWQELIERLPMARAGQGAEVGAAVVFLATNGFITGESIRVDGGEHLLGAGHRRL